jgi:hypothetical protein
VDGDITEVKYNYFKESLKYDFWGYSTDTKAEYNYWGTTDREEIRSRIQGDIDFEPWLDYNPLGFVIEN